MSADMSMPIPIVDDGRAALQLAPRLRKRPGLGDLGAAFGAPRRKRRALVILAALAAVAAAFAARPTLADERAAVLVRSGEHPGFSRLVFDWTTEVPYVLSREAGTAVLRFQVPRKLDLAKVQAAMPTRIRAIDATVGPDAVSVRIALAEGVRLRDFRARTKVVLDILDPEKLDSAAAKPASDLLPGGEGAPAPAGPGLPSLAAQSEAAETVSVAPVSVVPVRLEPGAETVTLRFDWPVPVAVAAFRRADEIWLVFDRPTQFDLRQVAAAGHPFISQATQTPSGSAAILVIESGSLAVPELTRVGTNWLVDFRPRWDARDTDTAAAQRIERRRATM